MISFKNNIKKSTLSFKFIVVCLLLSGSLTQPSFANGFCYTVVDSPIKVVSNKALTSNVVTLTSVAHGLGLLDSVTITGVDATFNGVYTITGITDDTFTYAKTATDVGSVASGGAATLGRVLTDDGTCTGALVIDNTVTSIGNRAFFQNTALTSVTIGDSVTSIGTSAFGLNTNLTSVIIGNSVTGIGGDAFTGPNKLERIIIPDSVLTIGEAAFENSNELFSVTIGNSVASIGASAFLQTDLYSVNIPDSVTSIGASAFKGNLNLEEVRFLGNAPTVGAEAFLDVAADATANIRKNAAASFVSTPWNGLIVVVAQYESSWQVVSGSLTGDDGIGQRYTNGFADTLVDTYELLDVPVDADVSIYIKGNPNDDGTGLCDPAIVIYDVTNPVTTSAKVKKDDGGLGGADDGYNGLTCARNGKLFDAFLKVSTAGENVSNFRIQVTSQGLYNGDLNDRTSGAYILYVNVGRAVLIGGPAGDSGSDSSSTTKTITPVAMKKAESITNMKNKTYLSKYSMKLKLRENNLFKYSASDSFKYQIFKSSKKSCGMMGNYVMRYENSKTCDLYITRTNAKGISNKYWVKINYLK